MDIVSQAADWLRANLAVLLVPGLSALWGAIWWAYRLGSAPANQWKDLYEKTEIARLKNEEKISLRDQEISNLKANLPAHFQKYMDETISLISEKLIEVRKELIESNKKLAIMEAEIAKMQSQNEMDLAKLEDHKEKLENELTLLRREKDQLESQLDTLAPAKRLLDETNWTPEAAEDFRARIEKTRASIQKGPNLRTTQKILAQDRAVNQQRIAKQLAAENEREIEAKIANRATAAIRLPRPGPP